MKEDIQFGIYHTSYEKSGDKFFDFVDSDYINTILVECNYKSEEFLICMNKLKSQKKVKAWIAVSAIGFNTINNSTIVDNGEVKSVFNPKTSFKPNWKENVDDFITFLKVNGFYDCVCGWYMDEPLLWNVTNDMLEEFTGYFRTKVAQDKRFLVVFSVAGVCPESWTINNVQPITPKSVQYLTDIGFDKYQVWDEEYDKIFNDMMKRMGNRPDLRLWMIPCTMNYRGDYKEQDAIFHLNKCYEILKNYPNPGGLMCYTYFTFAVEDEALGNVGLMDLCNPNVGKEWPHKDYWPNLITRVREIGKEIIENNKKR